MKKCAGCLLVAPAVLLLLAQAGLALNVLLKVQETAGVARVKDPCRSGVALLPGALKDVKKLRLLDKQGKEVAAQFRVMNRRLNGEIEWVSVNFLADVPAKGTAVYRLTDSGPAKPVANPVQVNIGKKETTVVTGPLKVVLPSDSFAGLGRVWLDRNGDGRFAADELVVRSGALVIRGIDGKTYTSVKDSTGPVRVTVEERGPMLTVLRIDGQVRAQTADGKSHSYPSRKFAGGKVVDLGDVALQNQNHSLGFTVRLHFWRGQSWVRSFVTIRNLKGRSSTGTDNQIRHNPYLVATLRRPGNFLVDGISMELDLAATGRLRYRIGGGVGGSTVHEGRLAAQNDGVTLHQDSSASWLWQAGSGRIFDERLRRNIQWMSRNAPEGRRHLPYWEYQPVWYQHLITTRDGASYMGYRLYRGAAAVTPGSTSSHSALGRHTAEGMRAPGWIELDDGRATVTVGCRWFWQMCPKSLSVRASGRVAIGLWSPYWPRGHVFEGRIHRTHELLVDFRPSGRGLAAPDRFAAFDQRLMAVADARYNLATGAFGSFMLPNPQQWPRMERSALTAVVNGVDPNLPPAYDSSFEIEREKYNHFGIWQFGDHSKGGYHYFSQFLENDVPYCLMLHFARTGDLRFYREAEIACRQVLDVPAHGGGYGHQRGESSHFYTTGNLLFSYITAEPWLKDAVRASYEAANPGPWHLRSFGITMWSSLDMYFHFPERRTHYRSRINVALAWWRRTQNAQTGALRFDRSWKTFFFGIGTDAMGRYCEAFPQDRAARTSLVAAVREWMNWVTTQDQRARSRVLHLEAGNGFAYAARFSGDNTFLTFAATHLVRDNMFPGRFRTGTSSAKGWSQHAHRLTQVLLHDLDRRRNPQRYANLP